MRRLKIIIPIALLLTFIFSLYIGANVIAQVKSDCQTNTTISTTSSDPDYKETWAFNLFTSGGTIDQNSAVEVWVTTNTVNCPPYSLILNGNGFHFGSIDGPIIATIYEDGERVELWADDTACGSAVITAVDNCNSTANASVRSNSGEWILYDTEICPVVNNGCHIRYDYLNYCNNPPFQNPEINGNEMIVYGDCARMECCPSENWSPPTGACRIWSHTADCGSMYCGRPGIVFSVFYFWQRVEYYKWECQ